jgi:hypothetical protein
MPGLDTTRGFAARGFAGAPGLTALFDLLAVRLADELLAAAGRVTLCACRTGLATDIVFAAAVSALVAVVMALVAVFMACSAVDIVLADDVALVAAVVILVAATLTFAAADETVLAAAAVEGAFLAAVRVPPDAPDLALLAGLLAVLLGAAPLRDPVRARFAVAPRAALRVVRCTGIDLPPNSDQLRETYSTVSSDLHRQAWRSGRTRS